MARTCPAVVDAATCRCAFHPIAPTPATLTRPPRISTQTLTPLLDAALCGTPRHQSPADRACVLRRETPPGGAPSRGQRKVWP